MSSSPSSSFSSAQTEWMYDVFLSFRGEDTRNPFSEHLYTALSRAAIQCFRDDEELRRGEEMSPSLQRAIEGSRIAIVVFSQGYASSRWCLNEVVKIMECRRSLGQVVIPIFFHIDPSDVRHQNGIYGEAMKYHELHSGNIKDWVMRCREALTAAANFSGYHSSNWRNESELIENVVRDVFRKLDSKQLFVGECLVGIESHVHELTSQIFEEGSQDVLIVGIWGMGGVGKTTLAKAIYNEIGHKFQWRSFLADIREVSEQVNGLVNLQNQLISDIIDTKILKVSNIDRGKNIISERFPHRKEFIVLDDVDSLNQLKALCGSRKWFGPGSVIIITTRDERLLNVHKANCIYKMKEMNESESLDLFSWHAFKQTVPIEIFFGLAQEVVAYCGGLPLALEVLGCHLFDREIEEWKSVLSKLETIPHDEIQSKLRISFDGLKDYTQKDIFLDICCFFINKDRVYVTEILNGCELHAVIGMRILIEKSLIKVNKNNKLEMHDLLREMGREIIRENPPKDPEDRSRLWFYKDAHKVLTDKIGTKDIKGLSLRLSKTDEEPPIDSMAFKEMKKLRLLQLDYVRVDGDYGNFSKELRWLCWHGFPLKYIPDNLFQKNLVAIDFKYSSLKQVWKGLQLLEGLKFLNLSHSCNLTQTPHFTKTPNLEKLILKDCPNLTIVDQSIGSLNKLVLVNMKDCKGLRDLPRSIYKLKSLKTLILSGCSMIDKLEEDIEQMESLTTLMAKNTAITQVPYSLARLKSLAYISLCGHEGRSQDIFPSLIWSWMSPMNSHQYHLPSISSIVSSAVQNSSLNGLSSLLGHFSKFRSKWEEFQPKSRPAPNTSQISYIEASASSSDGHNQAHVARTADSFNLLILPMGVCEKVDILKERILQGWDCGEFDDSLLPGDQPPDWFIFKGKGCSVFLNVPSWPSVSWGCSLKAMVLNIVYSSCMDNMTPQFLINILIINHTKDSVQHHKRDLMTCQDDEEWQSILSSIEPGDEVQVVLNIGYQLTVNKIVAYLVFEEK